MRGIRDIGDVYQFFTLYLTFFGNNVRYRGNMWCISVVRGIPYFFGKIEVYGTNVRYISFSRCTLHVSENMWSIRETCEVYPFFEVYFIFSENMRGIRETCEVCQSFAVYLSCFRKKCEVHGNRWGVSVSEVYFTAFPNKCEAYGKWGENGNMWGLSVLTR